MSRRKEVVTAAGTLICALGIGFVMQSTDLAKQRYGSVPKTAPVSETELGPQQDVSTSEPVLGQAVLSVDEVEMTSALDVKIPETPVVLATASVLPKPSLDAAPKAPEQSCDISVIAKPGSAAMVMLSVDAPCSPNERVTILHENVLFTQSTDAQGKLNVPVPAFAVEAEFVVSFNGERGGVARTTVADLEKFDRVALQWRGDAGFSLHARENGADYDTPGHVSSVSPRTLSAVIDGTGGFMSMLGQADVAQALMVEVYTFPRGLSSEDGDVDVSVEAEVTDSNCASEIEAQTMTVRNGVASKSRSVTFAVPSCDTVGDFLVLNNPLEDLKLAAK